MKKLLLSLCIISCSLFALNTQAASMSCEVRTNGPGQQFSSGSSCEAFDFSFSNNTTATFTIDPGNATVLDVIWIEGCGGVRGSLTCSTQMQAYFPRTARAIIILPDNRFESVSATAYYESGQ